MFQSLQRIRINSNLVAQSCENVRVIDRLESSIGDADTSQRGYIITGNKEFLKPFHSAADSVDHILLELEQRTPDDNQRKKDSETIKQLVGQKLDEMRLRVTQRRESMPSVAANVEINDADKQLMDEIRDKLTAMRSTHNRALRERAAASDQAYVTALLTALISTVVGLGLVAAIIWAVQGSRKKMGDAAAVLFSERERLQLTFASIGELVVVLDGDMQVLHVNRAFSTTFQITDDLILGRSIYQIDGGQWDLPAVHELLEGSLNKPDSLTHIEIEQRVNHIGRKFLRLTANKFAAGSRRKEALLLVISDVTDERVLEEKNRRQDQHMRWFLEQIKDYAIFTMDVECRATSWNQGVKQVLGFDESEFIGHDILKLIFTPEAQAAGIPEIEFSLAALDQRASDDRWMMRKGGVEFWASGITTSIRDQNDRLIGYCKVMRDLTSAKKSQDKLSELATRFAEMDRRKNEFLATLAHELRNPLAPIKNAVQLMGMLKLDPEVDELRQMMARQVEQLVRLIDDLLDISRISRGKISLRSEVVDLPAVIDAAVEASATLIAENGQQLIVNVPDDNVRVNGDPSRLTQVISNLLNNSAKYSDAGSRIELTVIVKDKTAEISVRDDGIGIAPEVLLSIFNMFSQADDTLERGSAGLGIGLTLVKTLVELHDGTVVAQSEGVGKGSTFTVCLPAIADLTSSNTIPAITTRAVSTRSFKVLIIEDMRALRVITARLLEKLGHEVEFVENGPQALLKLDTFTPDVVFSDIAMPGMTGYELAQRIRQRADCSRACLVALTGFGQSSDRDKALEAGFHEHMVKPVDISVLQSLFEKLSQSVPE